MYKIISSVQPYFSASRLNSCGTNVYESRKKRDLRSFLQALVQETKEKKGMKNEQIKKLLTEKNEEKLEERVIGGTPSKKG